MTLTNILNFVLQLFLPVLFTACKKTKLSPPPTLSPEKYALFLTVIEMQMNHLPKRLGPQKVPVKRKNVYKILAPGIQQA